MSLPPPTSAPLGGSPASGPVRGWYTDPWDREGLRWWDGAAWTSYTDADYGGRGPDRGAQAAVAPLAGPTRWLATLVPLGALLQVASLALTWSTLRDVVQMVRDNDVDALQNRPVTLGGTLGQLLSLGSIAVLVLRMVWLHRATTAAAAVGGRPRRSPGLACCSWLIPIVNLWWPYQSLRDVSPDDARTRRLIGWWWGTYLFGALGALLAVVMAFVASDGAAVGALGVTGASSLVSALLERRLVTGADAAMRSRVGLNSAADVTTEA